MDLKEELFLSMSSPICFDFAPVVPMLRGCPPIDEFKAALFWKLRIDFLLPNKTGRKQKPE